MEPGVYGYVGAPGVGKTTLARREWLACAKANGYRALCIDSAGARNLADLDHAPDLESTLSRLFTFAEPVARTPADQDEVDALLRGVREGGRCAVLVDEIGFWRVSKDLTRGLRSWRHPQLAFFLVAHHIGSDLSQLVLACAPKLRVFRTTAPRSVEFLLRWHGVDPDALRTLPTGRFVTVQA